MIKAFIMQNPPQLSPQYTSSLLSLKFCVHFCVGSTHGNHNIMSPKPRGDHHLHSLMGSKHTLSKFCVHSEMCFYLKLYDISTTASSPPANLLSPLQKLHTHAYPHASHL